MPSKKGSIAYENRLARRRAERAIKRMEKELNSGSLSRTERFRRLGEITALKELKATTYIGRRGAEIRTPEEAQKAARSIVKREYVEIAADLQAQNLQAMHEIANTYYVDKVTKQHVQNPMSSYSEAEMRTFWRVTQNIWDRKGVSIEKRFDAIAQYVADAEGISASEVNMRELIDAIIEKNSDKVAAWQREIDKKNAKKAAGVADVKADDIADFSSTDIVALQTTEAIMAVLEAYRQRGGISDAAQEE